MSSYSLTKARVFQYVGILFALGLIAVGYWYFSARAGVKSNTAASQPQGVGQLDSGLAGYWKFDDGSGTTATDASTNGNNGTLTNGPTWTTGQIGGAVTFDGSDDYINTNSGSALDNLSVLSYAAWIYPTASSGFILGKKSNTGGVEGFQVISGTLQGWMANGSGEGAGRSTSTTTVPLNAWSHVAMTYNHSGDKKPRLYINGAEVAYSEQDTISNGLDPDSVWDFMIGYNPYGAGSSYFSGSIDEVRIYNRALSADEVGQLYRLTAPTSVDTSLKGYWSFNGSDISGTTAYDRSGVGNNGTLTNGPTGVNGIIGQGLSFDGSNDYVGTVGSAVTFSIYTACSWIKPAFDDSNSTTQFVLIRKNTPGDSDRAVGIAWDGANNRWFSDSRSAFAYSVTDASTPFKSGEWHHICFSYNNAHGTGQFYWDGISRTTTQISAISPTATSTMNFPFYIGSDVGSSYFTGSIDEVRVYNRVLTASEIKSLYDIAKPDATNSSSSQPQGTGRLDSGLAGYWKLDETTGSSAADTSTNGNTGTLTNMENSDWTTGQIGNALTFDGSNEYVTTDKNGLNDVPALTLSYWAYPTGSGTKSIPIFLKGHASGFGGTFYEGWGLGNCYDGNYHLCFVAATTGSQVRKIAQVGALTNNTWQHVTVTWDGSLSASGVHIYVNGSEVVYSSEQNGTGLRVSDVSRYLWISADSYQGWLFQGSLDEVRVYSRTLSADEIGQLYRLTSTTSVDTGLKGYWSFNGQDMNSTTAYDRSGAGNNGTLTNGPTIINGIIGQGLSFDGSDDYVLIPYTASLAPTNVTVSYWMKEASAPENFDTLIARRYNNTGIPYFSDMRGVTYQNPTFGTYTGSGTHHVVAQTSLTVGNWYHIVGTFDGSSYKIYINGVLDNTLVDSTPLYVAAGEGLGIGWLQNIGSPRHFDGSIDEVRVYDRALTATEIQGQYEAVKPDKVNSSATQPQGVGRLDSGLAGYWAMDNGSGTTATDASTNGNNGTLTGGPTWTTGQIGGAVQLDGTDDYISTSTTLASADSITLSAWVKGDSPTMDYPIFGHVNGQAGSDHQCLFYDNGGTENLIFGNVGFSGGNVGVQVSGTGATLGTNWHHVVYTNNGTKNSLYLDGIRLAETTSNALTSASEQNLEIGRCITGGGTFYFDGLIDEARVYRRALSADEIGQLYRLTSPTSVDTSLKGYWSFNGKDLSGTTAYDRSGMGNNGTLVSGPTVTNGKLGQALLFDGVDDYVNITSMPSAMFSNTTFTTTGWFKTSGDGYIIDQDMCDGGWRITVESGYLGAGTRANGSCGSGGAVRSGTTRVDDNKWHHFAVAMTTDTVTSGNNNIVIYIDGVLNQGTLSTGPYGAAGDSKVQIGARYSGFNVLPGSIDEVRIYNRALSTSEITSLYNASR